MPQFLTRALYAVLLLSFVAVGCDSGGDDNDDDNPPPTTVAPTFSLASVVVTLADGSQGLQFAATPNADVELTRVNIRNPLGQSEVFNANNNVFLSGQSIALQDPGIGYVRVSGDWSFQFIGRRAAGDQSSFDVTVPLSVSAAQETTGAEQ